MKNTYIIFLLSISILNGSIEKMEVYNNSLSDSYSLKIDRMRKNYTQEPIQLPDAPAGANSLPLDMTLDRYDLILIEEDTVVLKLATIRDKYPAGFIHLNSNRFVVLDSVKVDDKIAVLYARHGSKEMLLNLHVFDIRNPESIKAHVFRINSITFGINTSGKITVAGDELSATANNSRDKEKNISFSVWLD